MKKLNEQKGHQSLVMQYNKDAGKEFSKSVYNWLAQHDEEYDFLSGKVSNYLPEFTEEE